MLTGGLFVSVLLQRPDPILWYDSIPLFEDELHDNGVASLTVRVRVMEGCFLVLLQFWLRVDEMLMRVYDTRLFHQFGTQHAVREQMIREDSFDELAKVSARENISNGNRRTGKTQHRMLSHSVTRSPTSMPLRPVFLFVFRPARHASHPFPLHGSIDGVAKAHAQVRRARENHPHPAPRRRRCCRSCCCFSAGLRCRRFDRCFFLSLLLHR